MTTVSALRRNEQAHSADVGAGARQPDPSSLDKALTVIDETQPGARFCNNRILAERQCVIYEETCRFESLPISQGIGVELDYPHGANLTWSSRGGLRLPSRPRILR